MTPAGRFAQHLALAVAGFLAVVLGWRIAHAAPPLEPSAPAPAFSIPKLAGSGTVDLRSYAGRAVVLNFWASWCGPCQSELRILERAWRRWRGDVVSLPASTSATPRPTDEAPPREPA